MFATLLKRIGGPNAVSLKAWVALAPIPVIGSIFTFGTQPAGDHFPFLLLASLTSYLFSGPIFIFARKTYLNPSPQRPSRPIAALLTFASAGLLAGVTFNGLVDSFNLGIETGSGVGRAWLGVFWSSLIALVLDASTRFRTLAAELAHSIEQTANLAEQQVTIVAEMRSRLVENLKETILAALNSKEPRDLNAFADEVIRPLRVNLDRDLGAEHNGNFVPISIRLQPLFFESLRNPVSPWLIALASSLAGLVATMSFFSFASLANSVVVFIMLWITLLAMSLGKFKSAVPGALLLATGALASVFTGLKIQDLEPLQVLSFANLNVGCWLMSIFMGVQLTLDRERSKKLIDMNKSLEALVWQQQKLQQVTWAESRRLSKFVHSDIQGRIRAAAIRSDNLSPAQLENLRMDCMVALDRAIDPMDFQDFLDQSTRLWEGILNIDFQTPTGIVKLLEEDGFAKAAAIEVIREGLCNAVRHGKASSARVNLSVSKSDQSSMLIINVSNDGVRIDDGSQGGFGSEILDDATSHWSLSSGEEGVELVASIPLFDGVHTDKPELKS